MNADQSLRDHLAALYDSDQAHLKFDDAVKDFPSALRGKRPAGSPHSPWELLEHLRIAQWDILEFTRDAKHASPKWPEGYWPQSPEPSDDKAWDASVEAYRADQRAFADLIRNEADLHAKVPHGTGQTILREILLAIDHNAYHLGQLVTVRKTLGA